jgi:hypothetical protein
MITVEDILPTKVVVGRVSNFDVIQQEIKTAVDETEFSYVGDWGRTHKLSNSYDWNTCIISDYKMTTFEREMYEAALYLSNGIDFGYALNSWLTKYDNGDYAHIHNHSPASFSGAYCYKTGDDVTSRFFFDNGVQREYFDLQVGDFLIFPSHFAHGVTTNMSDTSRITLAFNFVAFRKELLRT